MLKYAREDTHYLLYIYDQLKNQILEKGGKQQLFEVLEESKKLCAQVSNSQTLSEMNNLPPFWWGKQPTD